MESHFRNFSVKDPVSEMMSCEMMNARFVYDRYGGPEVLQLVEGANPPAENEILVKICTSFSYMITVNPFPSDR